jgi:hypothetical protein
MEDIRIQYLGAYVVLSSTALICQLLLLCIQQNVADPGSRAV